MNRSFSSFLLLFLTQCLQQQQQHQAHALVATRTRPTRRPGSRHHANTEPSPRLGPNSFPSFSSTARSAALVQPSDDSSTAAAAAGAVTRSAGRRLRRWPGRVWSKLAFTRRREAAAAAGAASQQQHDYEDFILKNFQTMDPETQLPGLTIEDITETVDAFVDSEFFDVKHHQVGAASSAAAAMAIPMPNVDGNAASVGAAVATTVHGPRERRTISLGGAMAMLTENALSGIIGRLAAEEPEDLTISAKPRRRRFMAQLLRGHLCTDAELDFGNVIFPNLHLSSGRLNIEHMTFNLLHSQTGGPRFPNQFDMHFDDLVLTQDDLWNSCCLRNGLRQLLVRLLRDRGVKSSSIQITSLGILSNGKISCEGEAKTLFGSTIPFEVRTSISTSCHGHVLEFPGLEICLNRDIGFFVPVVPTINVDVGHNARFREIHIDGSKKQLKFSTSVTITPANTLRALGNYHQSKDAFAARFSVDVGKWLTNLGDWTGPQAA
eukprot:CAMPEP_0119551432 /NCGR_PEP_ID=MMETSP1352-20130426/4688_1 /TAXON_ID=265584 /ORGANISM="Stauroneis constricta, Strain CCMP1120" /LENGTH=491 /DNA_ID=CAMNT_0007597491 /DNA_START=529 /DNA_END=2004 /DNA_ORIENTATION=-